MLKDSKVFDAITAYKNDLVKNVYEAINEIRPRLKKANLQDPFEKFSQKV